GDARRVLAAQVGLLLRGQRLLDRLLRDELRLDRDPGVELVLQPDRAEAARLLDRRRLLAGEVAELDEDVDESGLVALALVLALELLELLDGLLVLLLRDQLVLERDLAELEVGVRGHVLAPLKRP